MALCLPSNRQKNTPHARVYDEWGAVVACSGVSQPPAGRMRRSMADKPQRQRLVVNPVCGQYHEMPDMPPTSVHTRREVPLPGKDTAIVGRGEKSHGFSRDCRRGRPSGKRQVVIRRFSSPVVKFDHPKTAPYRPPENRTTMLRLHGEVLPVQRCVLCTEPPKAVSCRISSRTVRIKQQPLILFTGYGAAKLRSMRYRTFADKRGACDPFEMILAIEQNQTQGFVCSGRTSSSSA